MLFDARIAAREERLRATQPPPLSLALAVYRDFCAANAVQCLDAIEGFARTDIPFDSLFIPGDDHFSTAGYQLIAEFLAEPLAHNLDSLVVQ